MGNGIEKIFKLSTEKKKKINDTENRFYAIPIGNVSRICFCSL